MIASFQSAEHVLGRYAATAQEARPAGRRPQPRSLQQQTAIAGGELQLAAARVRHLPALQDLANAISLLGLRVGAIRVPPAGGRVDPAQLSFLEHDATAVSTALRARGIPVPVFHSRLLSGT